MAAAACCEEGVPLGRRVWTLAMPTVVALVALAAQACGAGSSGTARPAGAGSTPAGATSSTQKSNNADYARLSGSVTVDGSSTVGPVTEAVAEEFGKLNSVKVAVGISGTGGGFEKFCRGETDINDASRTIKDAEKTACQGANVEYVEFKVGIDGITIVVNPSNSFVQCLTFSQLKKMWDEGATAGSWRDIDPSFPADGFKLFGPGHDSGTFDYFTEAINGKAKRSRADYTSSEDDNVLVKGVENEKSALGYFGYAYFKEAGSKLRAIKLDGEKARGCVAPTDATISDFSYPLARPLFIYVKKSALARPEVKGFVRYYIENAPELVAEVGYIPAPLADYSNDLKTLGAQ